MCKWYYAKQELTFLYNLSLMCAKHSDVIISKVEFFWGQVRKVHLSRHIIAIQFSFLIKLVSEVEGKDVTAMI